MTNYWNTFKDMVALEYLIQNEYKNATITMVSNNPELLDNTGRIIDMPVTTTSVTYDITVTIGDVVKTITLGSVIPGTNSWNQYNGMFSTR
jgi:N-acetylmuramoyl-L-alanine amidase